MDHQPPTADHPDASPPKPPGERLASYFENFFKTITAVATLGASITFAKIVQTPVAPFQHYSFSTREIQYLISLSWLFFVLTLGVTSFAASALSLWRPQAVKAFGTQDGSERRKVLWYASGVSAFLFALLIVAFLFISLVVVGYTGPVGWVALVFTIVSGLLGLGSIVWQSPLEWPTWLVRFEREEQEALERHMGFHVIDRKLNHASIRSEDLPTMPRQRAQQAQQWEEKDERRVEYRPPPLPQQQRTRGGDGGYDVGRSTSGDYGGGGSGGATWRPVQKETAAGYEVNRYSRASTVISDAYEPGTFGQGGLIYQHDDGVREGLVMSRYGS